MARTVYSCPHCTTETIPCCLHEDDPPNARGRVIEGGRITDCQGHVHKRNGLHRCRIDNTTSPYVAENPRTVVK